MSALFLLYSLEVVVLVVAVLLELEVVEQVQLYLAGFQHLTMQLLVLVVQHQPLLLVLLVELLITAVYLL
jgi:hypothetical protein